MDVAASVIGIKLMPTKLLAFAVSSFYCGVAGALYAFCYLGSVEPDGFSLEMSFKILFMIIIGGVGSIMGSFLGAGDDLAAASGGEHRGAEWGSEEHREPGRHTGDGEDAGLVLGDPPALGQPRADGAVGLAERRLGADATAGRDVDQRNWAHQPGS